MMPFKLNKTETKIFENKKRIFKDLMTVIDNKNFLSLSLKEIFSVKEIFSENCKEIHLLINDDYKEKKNNLFLLKNIIPFSINENLTEKEKENLQYFFLLTEKNSYINHTVRKLSNKYILNLLRLKKREILKNSFSEINNFLINLSSEEIEKNIKLLQDIVPEYENFPIIINNKNLKKETKIKIIKSFFKQKKFSKYATFLSQNLTDADDLDVFIEATIIQNNRIKNKDSNIINVIKRIFLGTYRDYSKKNFSKIKNLDSFLIKYKSYFEGENLNILFRLVSSSYILKDNLEDLIKIKYKNYNFFELIKEVNKNEKLKFLINTSSAVKFFLKDDIDEKEKKETFLYILNTNYRVYDSKINLKEILLLIKNDEKVNEILTKFSYEELTKKNKLFFSVNNEFLSYYQEKIDYEKIPEIIKFLVNTVDSSLIKNFEFIDKNILKKLFLSELNWFDNGQQLGQYTFQRLFFKFLGKELKKNRKNFKAIKEVIKRDFLEYLENNMSTIFSSISNSSNNPEKKIKQYVYSNFLSYKEKEKINYDYDNLSLSKALDFIFEDIYDSLSYYDFDLTNLKDKFENELKQNIIMLFTIK